MGYKLVQPSPDGTVIKLEYLIESETLETIDNISQLKRLLDMC
jgi:hypothetical protein